MSRTTEVWRVRIDPEKLKRADDVSQRLGTSTQELVRMFVAEIADSGAVPLKLTVNDPLLDSPRRNRILKGLDDSEGW